MGNLPSKEKKNIALKIDIGEIIIEGLDGERKRASG